MANKQNIEIAAKHLADLTTFGAILAIMEGSILYYANEPERKIIQICKAAMQKSLREYDRHVSKVAK